MRAEVNGLTGYPASVGAYVRELISLGQSVIILRDGFAPVTRETAEHLLSDQFIRGAAIAANVLLANSIKADIHTALTK